MFIGEFTHNLDNKGRLAIPVKFREDLLKGGVVTKGLDGCLVLYPQDEWQKLADKLAALPISQANSRAFSRLMLAGAMDVKLDNQGRIMLPDYLRKFASVTKKLIVTGLYNRVEIWDSSLWEKYRQGVETKSEGIAEQLGELGV
ncbi:MAG: division/cell wall cluster transcriptional repressor MraZ [Patescibacteria group bacterium]